MKKLLKIVGVILGIVILLLALSPFFFEGTIEKLIKKNIDKNVNADVAWGDFDLSLFKSFPQAALVIKDFSVVNRVPFKGDTLATGKSLKIDMGIMQLFKKGDEPISIDGLTLDDAFINIKIDSLGNTNYDVAIQGEAVPNNKNQENQQTAGFTFDLKNYEVNNSRINYLDEATKTFLTLKEVNHQGTGDFSLAQSELDTKTTALVSFRLDDVEYLSNNAVSLDALFQLDLENQRYTFLDNEAKVNELPLTFTGFVKVNEDNNEVDLSFKTPSSDFKNFFALIPEVYKKDLKDVQTTGDFIVNGALKGIVDETHIPTMDIKIESNNASFQYPDLPKTVRNISINAGIKNETGIVEDTFIQIGNLTFSIDGDVFKASALIRQLLDNPLINMSLEGRLNLANIKKVLPIEMEQDLTGVVDANLTADFDMNSVEKSQYQNIKTSGMATLTGFTYKDPSLKETITISQADMSFRPDDIKLIKLLATTGKTDITASGNIQNLVPFIISKEDLKGRFIVQSNTFDLNDFMTAKSTSEGGNSEENKNVANPSKTKEAVKIPDFLDTTLDFTANKVIYDNITLANTKGTVSIKDETATLTNISSNIFGGNVGLSGNVSTKGTPSFQMDLDLNKIAIAETFQSSELLKYLVPIASSLQGNFNTTLSLKGNLSEDLTPVLTTLAGNALATIITAEVDPDKTPLLSKLGDQVKFLNLDKLSLRDVTTKLNFDNGSIQVQPFNFNVKGINITVDGRHGLDKTIAYNLKMDVPAKYLGGDINKLLAKLDPGEAANMSVALPIGLRGTINNPQISVDTKAAVTTLTQRLIEKQKQDLTTKGIDVLQDILGGGTKKDSTTTSTTRNDSTKTQDNTTKVVKDILGGLFGKKTKKQDTTKSGNLP